MGGNGNTDCVPAHLYTEASRSSLQHTAMTTKKQNTFANVKGGQCLSCGIRGHISRNCRSKSKLQCTYCHKPGHVESVCFTKKRNTGNSNKVTPTDHHATATFFTASEQSVINNKQNNFNILVDCGATCHILNDANLFTSYDDTFDPKRHVIEVADGRRSSEIAVARGSGKVTLVDSHGNTATVILKDALLAPKFPTSLFSVRAATDSGARIIFRKRAAELTIQNTRFKFIQRGHLYFLPTQTMTSAHITRTLNEWHITLGHMNHDDILHLQSVTEGMTVTQQQQGRTCTTCLENKLTRSPKSVDDTIVHANEPLYRVHTDLCGPIEPHSREGYRYIMNFVDEHSSMLFVYFLHSKDKTNQALMNFLADVAPYGRPKEIHSDNGTKYTNKEFRQTLRDNYIKQTTTAPYSPFQNGKSERNWRSLLEMGRCLLADAKLPKFLWPYAVRHAQYLRNRSYQRRTGKTAYELFTNTKPDMRHIHPFGASCTVYIEGQKSKLSPRGQEATYLGINPTGQGYYVLNPANNSVTTSRNVRIHDTAVVEDDYDILPSSPDTLSESHADHGISEPDDTQTAEGRPCREVKPPEYLKDYYCTTDIDYACTAIQMIPETYEQAITSDDAKYWKVAMDAEINMLTENDTREITPLPPDRNETKGKWVYTKKTRQKKGRSNVQSSLCC